MESRNQNTSLWNRNVELRDNGVLSIGTVFRIIDPCPIGSLMASDITLLNTDFTVVIIQSPRYYKQVLINYQFQVNNDFGFVLNGVTATLDYFNPISTSCPGIFVIVSV